VIMSPPDNRLTVFLFKGGSTFSPELDTTHRTVLPPNPLSFLQFNLAVHLSSANLYIVFNLLSSSLIGLLKRQSSDFLNDTSFLFSKLHPDCNDCTWTVP
jgi:hypothetical protein